MQHEGAAGHFQILKGQVARAAIAGRAVVKLPRLALGVGDEFGQIFDGQIGVNHIQAGHLGDQRDGCEITFSVVAELGENKGVDRQRANVPEDQGVVIGAIGHLLHGNVASGARFVFNKHVLPHGLDHFTGHRPRHNFRTAPRCKRDDQTNGLDRPGRLCVAGRHQQRGGCGSARQK